MPELTPQERTALRARAHKLDPVVMIGDKGLTESVLAEIGRALDAHELIKVKAASDEREQREAWLEQACEALGAAPVQHIGKILVLFRENPELHRPAPKRPGMTGRSPGKLKR
jgi:putative YhbY family RNA-binding protein